MRRGLTAAACVALAGLALGLSLRTAAAQEGDGPSPERDLTPATERAIESGIAFLVQSQSPDGGWLSDGPTGRYPVAMTALAGMALLANGSTPYSGPHAPSVRRAVEFLLQRSNPETGLIGGEEAGRPMFGHGFAMLFLAEVHGSEPQGVLRARVRETLEGAVRLTVRTQNELGGWYYTPDSTEDEGAVTITQVQGLRACANAGIAVPAGTVEGALDYVRKSVNPDGGIAYRASVPGESRPAITAAAVATMYAAGLYEGDMVEGAFRYARQNVPPVAPSRAGGTHFFYAHLYLSQVMYFRGGDEWRAYFPVIRDWLVHAQNDDGSWNGDYIGRAYGTAVALLILQLPYNNLSVIER